MEEDRKWEICKKCNVQRERRVSLSSGRSLVSLPRSCETKDACERELMAGYQYFPDREIQKGLANG